MCTSIRYCIFFSKLKNEAEAKFRENIIFHEFLCTMVSKFELKLVNRNTWITITSVTKSNDLWMISLPPLLIQYFHILNKLS